MNRHLSRVLSHGDKCGGIPWVPSAETSILLMRVLLVSHHIRSYRQVGHMDLERVRGEGVRYRYSINGSFQNKTKETILLRTLHNIS